MDSGQMIWILFDQPKKEKGKSFVVENLGEPATDLYSPKAGNKLFSWAKSACKSIRLSKKNDIIVCWFDFQGVLCWWFCKLLLRKRKIVCVNIMLKDKATFKNYIAALLYKPVLKSKYVRASVTSKEYGKHISRRLELNRNFAIVHDVFHESYRYKNRVEVKKNSVFCGGRNGRDWLFIIEVARRLPDVNFTFIMPKDKFNAFNLTLPSNVTAKTNVTIEVFIKDMCECELVALPLNTEAPAGLIVMFQAAANIKYILTTDTMTTREYLSDGRGCLLPNDTDKWVNAINEHLKSSSSNKASSISLLNFLRDNCSEDNFLKGIKRMCLDFGN